jgi:hypothetical protein
MNPSRDDAIELHPVGWVISTLTDRNDAPRQADEGAPAATLVFRPELKQREACRKRQSSSRISKHAMERLFST